MEITELFEKYKSELDEDMKINELNLKEAQLMLPGRKHKWAFRLIQQKRDLSKLKLLKKRTILTLTNQIQSEAKPYRKLIKLMRQ